jgi:hypothetical protein
MSSDGGCSEIQVEEDTMPQEGQMPNRERPVEPRSFAVGDHGPFKGSVPPRPDDDIRSDVETALFYDEAVSSLGVQVTVQGGMVTLEGTVSSDLAKRLAEEDTWRVSGVRRVTNNLKVSETPTPSRAAGQDLVDAKPPEPIYGEPPEREAQKSTEPPASGQPGKQRAA